MLIWLIVSIVRWIKGNRKIFKWWGITATTLCGLGLIIYFFATIFSGAPYAIASEVDIHVPMSVHVLENDSYVAIDGSESYTVVHLNDTEMHTFINLAKRKGWKFASVVPYSLLRVPAGDYLMSDKTNPLPKTAGWILLCFRPTQERKVRWSWRLRHSKSLLCRCHVENTIRLFLSRARSLNS